MIIFEPQCIGFAHAKVNAAYILLYSKAFPVDPIEFYGEVDHVDLVKKELSTHTINITYFPIEIPNTRLSYLARLIREFKNAFNILLKAKRSRSNVLLLSITSSTLLATKILGYGAKQNIYIVVHGVLETIIEKPVGFLRKVFWFRNYFTNLNSQNIKYILLGNYIRNNVLALLPTLANYTCSLELPYDLVRPVECGERKIPERIIFASAGVATTAKGSHLFFNLAQDVMQNYKMTNVEFCYIGHFVDEGMNEFVNDCVDVPSKDYPLEKVAYETHFLSADFLVFFYPKDAYKLTFSGVFLDAVKFEKPIIAIRNDFFSYYFDKYGDLGWLCDDYEEVLDLVIKLTNYVDPEELERFARGFDKVKHDLSMYNQAGILRELLA